MLKKKIAERIKRLSKIKKIKKDIKEELSIDQKISANEVFNFLKEYKKSLKVSKNKEFSEINKTNMNISILNARLNILGRKNPNRYYELAINRLDIINNFFMKKEEMIVRTKYFLKEIENIPENELGYDINFMKSITVQTSFNVEKNFKKIFTDLLKKSHQTTNIKEFYVLLDLSCNKLDSLFVKKNNVNIN